MMNKYLNYWEEIMADVKLLTAIFMAVMER